MSVTRLRAALALLAVAGSTAAYGQDSQPTAALTQARQLYAASFANEAPIFNGPEYVDFVRKYHTANGHPFFGADEVRPAAVVYEGAQYEAIPVRYDIVHDQLVTKLATSPLLVRLVGEKINQFTLDGHTFVRLQAQAAPEAELTTGFYDLIFADQIRVLVKRSKEVQERATTQGTDAKFKQKDKFYLQKGPAYYEVSSKGSVLKALTDKKKELQKYISTQKLSFKGANREASLLALANYYRTL